MATTVFELDWDRIQDVASGIRELLKDVRNLRWAPDGTDKGGGHWPPARWTEENVCGLASAYLAGWKITVAVAFEVTNNGLSDRRADRWTPDIVGVEPEQREQTKRDQAAWSQLPEGEYGDEEWDAVQALDEEGVHDLAAVIEEVVRYLLDRHELTWPAIEAEEAVMTDLRADLARWVERDARDVDLCRVAHTMASRD